MAGTNYIVHFCMPTCLLACRILTFERGAIRLIAKYIDSCELTASSRGLNGSCAQQLFTIASKQRGPQLCLVRWPGMQDATDAYSTDTAVL